MEVKIIAILAPEMDPRYVYKPPQKINAKFKVGCNSLCTQLFHLKELLKKQPRAQNVAAPNIFPF